MSILVPFNGINYVIPTPGETGWGSNLDSFFVAIGAGCLQKIGGSFLLASEVDFGASFGLKALYYKAEAGTVAASGTVRLASADPGVVFRNNANSGDLALTTNASDQLTYNGNPITTSGSVIKLPDGSSAAPSLTFAAQTDLGIYRLSSEAMAFAVGGVGIAAFVTDGLLPVQNATFNCGEAGNIWNIVASKYIQASDGSTSGAAHTFSSEITLGWNRKSSGIMAAVSSGNEIMLIEPSNIQVNTSLSGAQAVHASDYTWQATNTDNTGASQFSAYNGTAGATVAMFGTSYVGSRMGVSVTGMGEFVSAGNGMVLGTRSASPLYIGTNDTLSATVSSSQTWSFVNAPVFSALTASTVPYISAGKALTSSAVTPTELGFVSGVTSSIQTQLNAKTSSTLTSAHIFVGNGSNVATDTAVTGDVSLTNAGVTAVNSVQNGVVTNAMVNASAAIAYSKLNLTGNIVNADISSSAAIARAKLAAGTAWRVLADDGSGNITEISFGASGQVLTSTGGTSLPTFQNVAGTGTVNSGTANQLAYYASSTNAVSGLTAITGNKALASNASGLPVASTTSDTELGYVAGVTSAIQTQLNTKAPTASPTFTGTANFAAITTSGQVGVGAAPDQQLTVTNNQNNTTRIHGLNNSSGASAVIDEVLDNGTNGFALQMFGTGNTSTYLGVTMANYARIRTDGGGQGLIIGTGGGNMLFATADIKALTIDTSQNSTFVGTLTAAGLITSTSTVESSTTGTSVSTSATTILNGNSFGAVVVTGHDSSSPNARFVDFILYALGGGGVPTQTITVVNKAEGNSPAARTYTGSSANIQLAMASGTYTVKVLNLTAL